MLRIFVFFSFVCAWCAEPVELDESSVRGEKEHTFSVPSCWKREVWLSAPLEGHVLVAKPRPKGLAGCSVLYAAEGDCVLVSSEHYRVSCRVFWTNSFSSGRLLELKCTASGTAYHGSVMMCPFSAGMGGMVLVKPLAKGSKVVSFEKSCGSLGVAGPGEPVHLCDYAVNDCSFTIDRLVQLYADGSFYFVGVTFYYSQLNRALIEWGIKKGTSREPVDFDLFEFPPSKGGPPFVYKT